MPRPLSKGFTKNNGTRKGKKKKKCQKKNQRKNNAVKQRGNHKRVFCTGGGGEGKKSVFSNTGKPGKKRGIGAVKGGWVRGTKRPVPKKTKKQTQQTTKKEKKPKKKRNVPPKKQLG